MGMYNEVFKKCSDCGFRAEIQIPQVVLGFGNFDLDTGENISDLSYTQKIVLRNALDGKKFYCEECMDTFTVAVELAVTAKETIYI